MARTDKAAAVAELTEQFRSSAGAVLTEYRGLSVAQLRELRGALGETVNYAVVKNTLTKIAAKDAGVDSFDGLLQGPSAIAFIKGDPVAAAKALRDFAKAHPLLVIKGGALDGKTLEPGEIRKLADLESREVLLAKLAGAMKAAPQNAVSLFAAPLAQAARLFVALQDKLAADVGAGSAENAAAPAGENDAAAAADGTAEPARDDAAAPAADDTAAPAGTDEPGQAAPAVD